MSRRRACRAASAVPPPSVNLVPRADSVLQLLLRVLVELDDRAGVLVWLFDDRGRLGGLLVGPATWPIEPAVADLLVEQALVEDAAAAVVVRLRSGTPVVTVDDERGFAAFDAACGRGELPVLWHLVCVGGQVLVQDLQ
jgi:hypothetical protein